MVGGGGGWDLFFLNFLRALLEPSPKSAAGSNLGPKMDQRDSRTKDATEGSILELEAESGTWLIGLCS